MRGRPITSYTYLGPGASDPEEPSCRSVRGCGDSDCRLCFPERCIECDGGLVWTEKTYCWICLPRTCEECGVPTEGLRRCEPCAALIEDVVNGI